MITVFKRFNLMGKIGLIVGLIGALIGATVAINANPLLGIIFTGLTFGIIYIAFRITFGSTIRQEALMKSGVQAEATILGVRDTRMTVNEIYPVIRFTIEVRPPDGQPFQAETKELINRMDIPNFQPGAVVPVLYDPKNPKNVVFGTREGLQSTQGMMPAPVAAAGGTSDAEKVRMAQEFLEKEEKEHEEIRSIGKPAKAKILIATPLGMNVNGNNPAMSFMLEVYPEGEPSFQAQTSGVIAEASIPKYQPGREIFIKYDPADKTRVSLDHS